MERRALGPPLIIATFWILEVFAVPVVTQPVLSAFVMAAALGLLRVRRAGGLRSGEPLEKTAHRLLCE